MRKEEHRRQQEWKAERQADRQKKIAERTAAFQANLGRIKKFEIEHRPFILLGLALGAVLLVVIWLVLVML